MFCYHSNCFQLIGRQSSNGVFVQHEHDFGRFLGYTVDSSGLNFHSLLLIYRYNVDWNRCIFSFRDLSNIRTPSVTAELSADCSGLQVLLSSDLCYIIIILRADCSSARKRAGEYPKSQARTH